MIKNLLEVLRYNMKTETPWIDIIELKLLAASSEGSEMLLVNKLTLEQQTYLENKGLKVVTWDDEYGISTSIYWGEEHLK